MPSPPGGAPVPADPSWRLTRQTDPQADWYREMFRSIGQDWLWFSRLRLDDRALLSIITDPSVDVFKLQIEGHDKGLLELDRRPTPDIEITFIGLTRDGIGRGAGRFLLDQAVRIAWSYQPRRVLVHTCTLDHPRALPLYLSAGFVAWKRAVEIANDPRVTGELPLHAAPHFPVL